MQLVFERGEFTGRRAPLDRPSFVIGRSETCDLTLPEQGISRQHARIERSGQGWTLTDLGSTNGTLLNGQRLRPQQPRPLRPGDRVAIGSFVARIEGEPAGPAGPGLPEDELFEEEVPSGPNPTVMAVGAVAVILVLVGLVLLAVNLLKPEPAPVTPTVEGPMEQIMTVLPVPTGFDEVVTAVAPLFPSGLPFLPTEPAATPTPEAAAPAMKGAVWPSAFSARRVP